MSDRGAARRGGGPYERLYVVPRDARAQVEGMIRQGRALYEGATIELAGEVAWSSDGGQGRSALFHKQAWNPLDLLFCVYDEGRDPRHGRILLHVADHWCRTFPEIDVDEFLRDAGWAENFVWYDMAAGLRAYRLAYLADLLMREASGDGGAEALVADAGARDAMAARLVESYQRHRAYLMDDANFRRNNHGLYQAFGQIASGTRLGAWGVAGAAEMREQGLARLGALVDLQFASDGIHKEHSPGYQRAVAKILTNVVREIDVEGLDLRPLLDRVDESLEWLRTPGGARVNFGDTLELTTSAPAAEPEPGTVEARTFAEGGYWVVRGRPERPDDAPGAAPEAGSEAGSEAGPGEARRFDYLALASAFHSRTHKHADDGTFVWHERGRPMLIDGGRHSYDGRQEMGSDLWRDGYWYAAPERVHVERSRAHNTVEIDGRNHPRRGVRPYGSGLVGSGTVDLGAMGRVFHVACEARSLRAHVDPVTQARKPIDHFRILAAVLGRWVVCIDVARGRAPSQARQWFNTAPRFELARWHALGVELRDPEGDTLRIESLVADVGPVEMGRGWSGPSDGLYPGLMGWHSTTAKSFHPNVALALGAREERETWCLATLLSTGPVEPDLGYARVNATARRGRFRFAQGGCAYTLSYHKEAPGEPPVLSVEASEIEASKDVRDAGARPQE